MKHNFIDFDDYSVDGQVKEQAEEKEEEPKKQQKKAMDTVVTEDEDVQEDAQKKIVNQEEKAVDPSDLSSLSYPDNKNTIDLNRYSYEFRASQTQRTTGHRRVSQSILDQIKEYLSDNHKAIFQEAIVDTQKRANLGLIISEYIARQKIIVTGFSSDELIKTVTDSLAGLGILEALIDNENITDININGKDEIWVEELGKGYYLTDLSFTNEDELYGIAMKIVNASGESLTSAKPYVDCRFPGMRINIVTGHICGLGISISIRKFAETCRINDESIIQTNQANEDMVKLFEAFVKGRLNILIAGSTGSGKTELLKYFVKHVPDSQRMIMLEDTAETRLKDIYPNKHILPMECRFTSDDETTIDYITLLQNSLRQNPVRIGVGECRGAEAMYMIEIFNTGHEGGITTAHANSAPDAVKRLVMMCMRAGMRLEPDVIGKWVTSTFDVVIQVEKMEDGARRITEVIELIDYEENSPVYNSLYELVVSSFERDTDNPERVDKVHCHHERKGYLSSETLRRLRASGIEPSLYQSVVKEKDKKELVV